MQNLIGVIMIAAAVGGAIAYNGYQDRLQRQCLAMLETVGERNMRGMSSESPGRTVEYFDRIATAYKLKGKTNPYCMTARVVK